MKKAARAMGLGDDWKKAIEKTKDQHAPPGGQPAVIRDLLYEAIDYLRAKDLITVPQVAAESLRMSMMSPQRQLVEPVLHRRRADHRVVPDGHDGVRRAHPEHARQHHRLLARDRAPRDDPGPQPRRLHGQPLRRLPRRHRRQHVVLRRRLAGLLGNDPLRHGLPRQPGGARRRALLADAPLGAHHLLAQLPHGHLVAAGVHRLPRREGRPRARQRHRRGPPVLRSRSSATARSTRPRICSARCSCAASRRKSSTPAR